MSGAASGSSPGPHGRLTLALDAALLDVGLAGIAIETETRLSPELALAVRLGEGDEGLELPGRVVWCFFHGTVAAASGEQRPLYRAGIEFADLLTPSAQRLVNFLERQLATGGETRLFGRFALARSQPLRIATSQEFRCLEIGSERVTVELEAGFEPAVGQQAELAPRGDGPPLRARVADVARGAAPSQWSLALDVAGADARALGALRGVVFN